MTILIVDDEINIRENMSKFIDKLNLGFEFIETASSGSEGLEKALKIKPDILISDIIIPEFNGLELLNRVNKFLPKCKFIVISGHDDTEYFKTSIKLNVVDYLLKPIKPMELKSVIIKCLDIIKVERQQEQLTNQLKKYISDNALVMKHHYFKMMLDINEISDLIINQMRLIDFRLCDSNNIILSIVSVNVSKNENYDSSYYELFEAQMTIDMALKKISEKENLKYYIVWEDAATATIGFYDSNNNITKNMILSFYERVIDILNESKLQIFVCISDNIKTIKNISGEYKRLQTASKNVLLTGFNNIIFSSDIYLFKYTKYNYSKEFNKLLEKYNMKNQDGLKDIDLDIIKVNIAIEMLVQINKYCNDNVIDHKLDYNKLLNLSTIDEFNKFYQNEWTLLEKKLINRSVSRADFIINSIKNYVNEFYNQNIGVATIAENIKISPNYCGALFKEETGEKINQYINRIRIEKACKLIKDTDFNITRIGHVVGYESIGYFAKQFKTHTGHTPSEYKDSLIKK